MWCGPLALQFLEELLNVLLFARVTSATSSALALREKLLQGCCPTCMQHRADLRSGPEDCSPTLPAVPGQAAGDSHSFCISKCPTREELLDFTFLIESVPVSQGAGGALSSSAPHPEASGAAGPAVLHPAEALGHQHMHSPAHGLSGSLGCAAEPHCCPALPGWPGVPQSNSSCLF